MNNIIILIILNFFLLIQTQYSKLSFNLEIDTSKCIKNKKYKKISIDSIVIYTLDYSLPQDDVIFSFRNYDLLKNHSIKNKKVYVMKQKNIIDSLSVLINNDNKILKQFQAKMIKTSNNRLLLTDVYEIYSDGKKIVNIGVNRYTFFYDGDLTKNNYRFLAKDKSFYRFFYIEYTRFKEQNNIIYFLDELRLKEIKGQNSIFDQSIAKT